MRRREFISRIGAGVGGVLLGSVAERGFGASNEDKPNVLLLIGDDMTWLDCEPYGSRQVRTPNMRRLAEEGMCFDRMFTATAMCAPTRQQLYTGMFPVRNGAYPNHSKVYPSVRSLAHHLKELGYRVGLAGKTHFGPPQCFPFETVSYGKKSADDVQAISEFVNRDRRQPYLLIVASNEPHKPYTMGEQDSYDPQKLEVPPHLVDCEMTRMELSEYYAEITYLDGQLGKCMDIVDESGRRDNTMVIFTSEQGSQMPFGKWTCYDIGLKTAFIVRWPAKVKAGSRNSAMTQYVDVTPTLVEAAGGDPKTIDTGIADADGHRGFDGRSFLKVLMGRSNELREYVYGAHTTRGIIKGSACYPVRSVRSKQYKYIWNPNHEAVFYNTESTNPQSLINEWTRLGQNDARIAARARMYTRRPAEELYDLENDPWELDNIADDPANAEIKKKLRAELDRWMAQQGDKGNATEMKAIERQGPNRKWEPYEPQSETPARNGNRNRRQGR